MAGLREITEHFFVADSICTVYGRVVPKNSILFRSYCGDVYSFEYFPLTYKGVNPLLRFYMYDKDLDEWSDVQVAKTEVTKKVWNIHANLNGHKLAKFESDRPPRNNPVIRHKHSGGFMREDTYRVTDYACGKMPQWVDYK